MTGNKYVAINGSGDLVEVAANQTSAGAGDAGKVVALNSVGQIDASMLSGTLGAPKYSLLAKSASFTASDPTGTYYRITASSALAITLPASPADGTVYKFKRISGTGVITFTANGGETIDNAGFTGGTMTLDNSGVVELVAVTGGWEVT